MYEFDIFDLSKWCKIPIKIILAGDLSGMSSSLIVLDKCFCASTSWEIATYQTEFSFIYGVTSAIIVAAIFPFLSGYSRLAPI